MHITALETVQLAAVHRVAFVYVETDAGVIGLGETYDKAATSIAAVHDVVAPLVLGRDARDIAGLSHLVRDSIQFHGRSGGELRAFSAVEMALWDALGKALDQPVYQLLGGRCRETVPVYNTCVSHGPWRDHERFMTQPGELADELLADGYTGCKVWPFDRASNQTLGQTVGDEGLAEGVRVVEAMRERGIGVGLELHGRWILPAAVRIAKAIEPFQPLFMEESIPAGYPHLLRQLRERTTVPLIGSEWLLSRQDVQAFLQAEATDILMTDPSWNGGLLESVRIGTLAESYGVPLVFHSCGGPLTHAAACHLAAVIPNLYAVETVRSFQRTYFQELSDIRLTPRDGQIPVPAADRPGLGVDLVDLRARDDAVRQRSEATALSDSGRYSVGDCWDDPAWSGSDHGATDE